MEPVEVESARVRVSGGRRARFATQVLTPATLAGAFLTWLGAFFLFPTGIGHPPPGWYMGAIWASTWLPLVVRLFGLAGYRSLGASRIRVDADTLSVRGTREIRVPREDVLEGLTDPDGKLRLRLRDGREITATLPEPDAAAILDALGLGPGRRRITYRWHRVFAYLSSGLVGLGLPMLFFALAPSPATAFLTCPLFVGLPWLYGEVLGRTFSERSIVVGADGMLSTGGGSGRRLHRWEDIADLRVEERWLSLVMKDGRVERVLCDPDDTRLRDDILASISEARELAARDPKTSALAQTLAEAGTSMGALREKAAKLLVATQGFRHADVSEEDVRAILEDPTASPEQRIAAAAALAATGEPRDRMRVRVAADATAAPKMRVALEAAAEDALSERKLRAARKEAAR